MASRKPKTPKLYKHTPDSIEKFGAEDLFVSQHPLPGIHFHNNPQLAAWVRKYGQAPDTLFQQGLAAPPLGRNKSGLRHYEVDFLGDPRRVLNLDVPLASQTPEVREALFGLGIDSDQRAFYRGYGPHPAAPGWPDSFNTPDDPLPMSVAELLFDKALRDEYMNQLLRGGPLSRLPTEKGKIPLGALEEQARILAAGESYFADPQLRGEVLNNIMNSLLSRDIPAAIRQGPGWSAGTAYAPVARGKSPYEMLDEQISEARAAGDVMQAQRLENLKDDASLGDIQEEFPGATVFSPREGTKEFMVFNPDAVNIRRIASILAALGLGTATAQAGEDRYKDGKTSDFSKEKPPEQNAGLIGSVKQMLSSAAAPAMKALDTSLSPKEIQAWRSGQQSPESAKELADAFREAMDMPVVMMRDRVTTPDEFLRMAVKANDLSPTAYSTAIASLYGMPYDEKDKDGLALRDALLDQLRENLPGTTGPYSWDTGVTPEQKQQFAANSPYGEARYRLSPHGEQGYQSERVYNLFTTYQSGNHGPVWSDVGSKAAGVIGGAVNLDTTGLALSRFNTPQGRTDESLYWWKQGVPDGTLGDSYRGMKYPSLSATTLRGVGNKLDNPDNVAPYFNSQLIEKQMFNKGKALENLAGTDRSLGGMMELHRKLNSYSPEYPKDADPVKNPEKAAEMRKLRGDMQDWFFQGRQFANAEYPEIIRQSGLGPGSQFLSPAGESLANFARGDWADAISFASPVAGALSKYGKLPKALSRGADIVHGYGKFDPTEAGEDLAIESMAQRDDETPTLSDEFSRMVTPMQGSPLVTDEQGQMLKADDPRYGERLGVAYEKRQNDLRRILDASKKLYQPQTPATKRSGSIFM